MHEIKDVHQWRHKPGYAFGLAFLFLLVTVTLGTFLRYLIAGPPHWLTAQTTAANWLYPGWANYKYFLHAHSHIGFLGWAYNALFACILLSFIPKEKQKGLMLLFWYTQLATLGMLIFFPLQGYARESIIFSTSHIFFSWAFAYMAWSRMQSSCQVAKRYLKLALIFMVISSFGPFAMGPLMVNGLAGSSWYYMAIYYYLHFQYNGWFIFALLALLYQYLSLQHITVGRAAAGKAFFLFSLGAVFTLSLSILWAEQQAWLFLLAAIGGIVQLAGCFYLYRSLSPALYSSWYPLPPLVKHLLLFASLAFLLKNVLQLSGALPVLAEVAFSNRNFIIAFLHLIFLGVVTPILLAEAFRRQWIPVTGSTRACAYLYLLAFVGSQLLLVCLYLPSLTALLAPVHAQSILIASLLMLFAVSGLGISGYRQWRRRYP